jgi:hypothetical protein
MRELLRTLADQLGFFFDPGGYRLTGSHVGTTYGDAWITFEGDVLAWRVVRDRSQVFLECRATDGPHDVWYSTDLLLRLLTGRRVDTAELTAETALWIEANLAELEARFDADRVTGTVEELKALKRRRAKDLFG